MTEDQPGRQDVGGEGDVIDITDLEHRVDIRLMRMRGKGVPEEDNCLDLVGGDHRANLKVPTFFSGIHPGDVKAGQFLDETTCALRGNQLLLSQHLLVIPAQCDHLGLFAIMRDQCNSCSHMSILPYMSVNQQGCCQAFFAVRVIHRML